MELSEIKKLLKNQNHAIARYSPGDKVTAKFRCVNEANNDWEYVLNETDVVGIVKSSVFGKSKPPKEGAKQECVVLWVDYSNMLVFLSNKVGDLEHISSEQKIPTNLIGKSGINAKILYKNETVFVCSLKKGKNPIVFCPTQLHYNDFEYTASKTVAEGEFCKLAFIHDSQPIAVLDDTHKLWQEISRKRKANKNEKVSDVIESKMPKLEKNQKEESKEQEKANIKRKTIAEETAPPKSKQSVAKANTNTKLETNKKRTSSETLVEEETAPPKSKQSVAKANTKTKLETNKKRTSSETLVEEQTTPPKPQPSVAKAKTETKLATNKKRTNSETLVEEQNQTSNTTLKKIKTEQEIDVSASDSEEDTAEPVLFYEDKIPDKNAAAQVIEVKHDVANTKTKEKSSTSTLNSLAGVDDFWNLDLNNISTNVESSDEDDDSQLKEETPSAKKKLTAAEKFKQQREEEARLREIEDKYADPKHMPDSIDQFDRLVLSDPNNSKHWINYMVFHLQSTEIDKARAVARRALKTISFRNSDDLINIWVALLNLELRYGSKECFDDTMKEALIYNEPLKVYLRAVEIITDARKTNELVDMINMITRKFKTEQEVWRVCANAYFTVDMTERAQQLLHKALASLPERDHVNTIVMFANLNHRHGEKEMAQTLLDQVVTSYPKRVDVWCQYVDMLVKEELIDSARNILERAVVQKIPLRKMRTIFKKYLEFEERFGNDTNIQRVKLLAMDYVNKNENL